MGLYTCLLRIDPAELHEIKREDLYHKFHFIDGINDDPNLLSIDKSREGIMYLLTGNPHPLRIGSADEQLFHGKEIVFAESDTDGLVYWELTAAEVSTLNQVLMNISNDNLQNNFNPVEMERLHIYPYIWDRGNEAYDYLHNHFTALKNFVAETATGGMAIVTVTT